MGQRPPYPSDLPDEAWELIRPVIIAWKARHPSFSGHEGAYDMREIVNAILYQARTGCQWRYLPHDLPPNRARGSTRDPAGPSRGTDAAARGSAAAARARSAPALAAKLSAFFVVFDVLQIDGRELLHLPYVERRARLQALFTDHALTAPWTLCPMTTDPAMAREWLESWTDVSGVEGIVVKPQTSRYMPGHRGAWTKVRRRDTTEAITGATTGTLARPQLLVLGRHDQDGRLRAVGRTVPLRTEVAHLVAEHLTAADPGHPWEGVTFAATWGSRDVMDVRLVRPDLVAEISADRSIDRGGVWRHPLRFRRLRLDMGVEDVPGFGQGPAGAAG
ncbi:transposase [Streptomyces sp. NPDC091371]|uniref:transposase n=1 Tax=Streptomyces sp. NPDC091371 TaxID=3155303 RepID=UPI00341E28DB